MKILKKKTTEEKCLKHLDFDSNFRHAKNWIEFNKEKVPSLKCKDGVFSLRMQFFGRGDDVLLEFSVRPLDSWPDGLYATRLSFNMKAEDFLKEFNGGVYVYSDIFWKMARRHDKEAVQLHEMTKKYEEQG